MKRTLMAAAFAAVLAAVLPAQDLESLLRRNETQPRPPPRKGR